MITSKTKTATFIKGVVVLAFSTALVTAPMAFAADAQDQESHDTTITGEIVDVMCYVDHNAMGDKHASCGEKCIRSGGPVGIVSDGKAYLVVGAHKPMNDELASYAGKTVTLKGKVATKGGMSLIENAEIVKK